MMQKASQELRRAVSCFKVLCLVGEILVAYLLQPSFAETVDVTLKLLNSAQLRRFAICGKGHGKVAPLVSRYK